MRSRIGGVSRSRRKRGAKHSFHSPEPSGHALAQEQGQTNAARLAYKNDSPHRTDNLGAKQLVLSGVLRDIELCGLDNHRRFFSACS
jgi:hypothetical protein